VLLLLQHMPETAQHLEWRLPFSILTSTGSRMLSAGFCAPVGAFKQR
jgi:hypothetical protein